MKKNKAIIYYVIIPIFLFLLGLVSSLIFNSLSFTTLTYSHGADTIVSNPGGYFQKDDKLIIEITGRENNLGIVSVNFEKFQGYNFIEEDRLLFRIKKDTEDEWFYESVYGIGGFEKSFTLPFGFPLIGDSKNNNYIIEIVSQFGQQSNSVTLSNRYPIVQSTYKYSSSNLLGNSQEMLNFLGKKILLSFTNVNFLFNSIIFFVPLMLYIFFALFINKKGITRRVLFYLVFPIYIIDSFIISKIDTGFVLLAIGIWVIAATVYRFGSSVSYLFSLLIVLMAVPVIILGNQDVIEKLSTYLFLFLTVGFVQSIIELKTGSKRVEYMEFIRDIIKVNGKG